MYAHCNASSFDLSVVLEIYVDARTGALLRHSSHQPEIIYHLYELKENIS
jgi:hypothetical protein